MSFQGSYVRATALVGLQEIVAAHGGDIVVFLEELGISPAALRDIDMFISFRQYSALLELIAARLNVAHLGLEITQKSPPEFPILGSLVLLANVVDDLEAFIKVALQFWKAHTNGQTAILLPGTKSDEMIFRYISDPFSLPARQLNEMALSMICAVARTVTARDYSPNIVRFQHRKPDSLEPFESHFQCPIEFGAEHNEIVFSKDFLKLSTKGRLKFLRPLAHYFINMRMERMQISDRSLATAVTLVIPTVIGFGKCNVVFVAEALNLNPKALQRQLASEGTSFSELFESVRRKLATQILRDSDAPIGRIAQLLDYSATPPFTTAFRRWENMTPLAYRKKFAGT